MAVSTLPFRVPVWQSGVANMRTRKLTPVASAAAIATKPKPNTAQLPLSIRPAIGSLMDQVLFKDQYVMIGDECTFTGSDSGKEVGIVMGRLERVAEGMREMELEKLKGRVRGGELCDEERVLMEIMSREIVSKFMEKPIEYLKKNRTVKMEEKLKDLNFLVEILEESFLCETKDKQSCMKKKILEECPGMEPRASRSDRPCKNKKKETSSIM